MTTEIDEFRCCATDEGCDDIENCPYNFEELFSHLSRGESQTGLCEKTDELVSIHRLSNTELATRRDVALTEKGGTEEGHHND